MPPGRRKATQPTTISSTQRTLAFGPHPNKITKPNQLPPSTTLKKPSQKALSLTPSPPPPAAAVEENKKSSEPGVKSEAEAEVEAKLAIREPPQPKVEVPVVIKSEAEERAARVGEGDVRKYWRKQEAARKAPRVHQQEISMHEKILRHFDLSSQYGPCIGINRLARWKRASKLGLNPPIEVLAVLVKEDVAEKRKLERAYMDELLDSKVVAD